MRRMGLALAILFIHPRPQQELFLGSGDRLGAVIGGLAYGLAGVAFAIAFATAFRRRTIASATPNTGSSRSAARVSRLSLLSPGSAMDRAASTRSGRRRSGSSRRIARSIRVFRCGIPPWLPELD